MAVRPADKDMRKALMEARSIIDAIAKADANEAETRSRVEWCFQNLMGYDIFRDISREYMIHGVGDSDYCDFTIQLPRENDKPKPIIMVEIKKVNMELSPKHLKQTMSYAINVGCEWLLLTNGRDWSLYHLSFTKPPQITLSDSWHLLTDDVPALAQKFQAVGYGNVKKDGLTKLWQKSSVLTPRNILKVILSDNSISMIRRELKKAANIDLSPEEIVNAMRHLLNESALMELESMNISLASRPRRKAKTVASGPASPVNAPEAGAQAPPAQ